MGDTENSDDMPLTDTGESTNSGSMSIGSSGSASTAAARATDSAEKRPARKDHGTGGTSDSFLGRIVQFWHDVRAELRRVSWPSAGEVQNTTIIVVVAVIFFAVYLFAVDRGISFLVTGLDKVLEKLINWLIGG